MPERRETGRFNFWKVNTARSHLSRQRHTELLATPNYRRLEKPTKKDTPNVGALVGPIWPVPAAAMKASPTDRTKKLAVAKYGPEVIKEEDKPRPELHLCGPFPGGHYASDAARNAECPTRIQHMAVPKMGYLKCQKREFGRLKGRRFRDRMEMLEEMHGRSIYARPPVEQPKPPPPPPPPPTSSATPPAEEPPPPPEKKKTCLDTFEDWERHYDWLDKRAIPKKVPVEAEEKVVRKGLPMSVLIEHAKKMAIPLRRNVYRVRDDDYFSVLRGALEYEITERVNELAKPRYVRPRLVDEPQGISRGALHAKATERTIQLAQPKENRKKPDMDLRENPFSVNPIALKAKCSPRIKKLAEPVKR